MIPQDDYDEMQETLTRLSAKLSLKAPLDSSSSPRPDPTMERYGNHIRSK